MTKTNPPGKKASGGQDTGSNADSKSAKKPRKSPGFIETTGFKPNWLETGPLPPDTSTLPIDADTTRIQLTPEQFAAIQAALQQRESQEAVEPVASTDDQGKALDTVDEVSEAIDDPPVADSLPVQETTDPTEIPDSAFLGSPSDVDEAANDFVEDSESIAPPVTLAVDTAVDAVDDTAVEAVDEIDHEAVVEPDETVTVDEVEPVTAPEIPAVESPTSPPTATRPTSEKPGPASGGASAREHAVTPVPAERQKTSSSMPARKRVSPALLILALLLLVAAAMIYFANPFARLALATATVAEPSSPSSLPVPERGTAWCAAGDFLPAGAAPLPLNDNGRQGDIVSGDLKFSLDYRIAEPGNYQWQVVNCADPSVTYPSGVSWLQTTRANEEVSLMFDGSGQAERLFLAVPFAVSAVDSAENFRVVGSFQGWNPTDVNSDLRPINAGLYQQVRRIADSGTHQAYVIAGDASRAYDAYGRTSVPIPFDFSTSRDGDYAVFFLDTVRGRASVLYGMAPYLAQLAFGGNHTYLSAALALLAGLLVLAILLRLFILRDSGPWLDHGCPKCGEHELMRIGRRGNDRLLQRLGIPAYRYRCRHCTWEGLRLSEDGGLTSPGVSKAQTRF